MILSNVSKRRDYVAPIAIFTFEYLAFHNYFVFGPGPIVTSFLFRRNGAMQCREEKISSHIHTHAIKMFDN